MLQELSFPFKKRSDILKIVTSVFAGSQNMNQM